MEYVFKFNYLRCLSLPCIYIISPWTQLNYLIHNFCQCRFQQVQHSMCKKPQLPLLDFFLKTLLLISFCRLYFSYWKKWWIVNMTEESLLCTRKKRNPSSFSAAWLIYQWNKHPKGEGGFTVALYIDLQLYQRLFFGKEGWIGQTYSLWLKRVLFAMRFYDQNSNLMVPPPVFHHP